MMIRDNSIATGMVAASKELHNVRTAELTHYNAAHRLSEAGDQSLNSIDLFVALMYGALVAYCVLASWKRYPDRPHTRLLWIITAPFVAFASLWLAGFSFWFVSLAFALLNAQSPERVIRTISVTVALLVSLLVFYRLFAGRASRRFVWIVNATAIFAVMLFSIARITDFIDLIDGWSAEDAAQKTLYKWGVMDSPLVDRTKPVDFKTGDPPSTQLVDHGPKSVSYLASQDGQLLLHVVVEPYRQDWWRMLHAEMWHTVGVEGYLPSNQVWSNIQDFWDRAPDISRRELKSVIEQYPNSKAEKQAVELLDKLDREHPADAS
jgi:hypothetical protein